MAELLALFRRLASFSPEPGSLEDAPWDGYVDWAIGQGLGPLASYNLEYRLPGAGAPDWVRDRLLSVFQGTANDNVMKLVSLKRALAELSGRRVVVLDGASFTEALYPHMAFRPVLEVRLWGGRRGADGLSGFLASSGFVRLESMDRPGRVLGNGHLEVRVLDSPFAAEGDEEAGRALEQAVPFPVYGPSAYRLGHEDAISALVADHARQGYEVPLISFVDLRELLLGAPAASGPYSRMPDFGVLKERAQGLGLERALWASAEIVRRLFPEAESAAREAQPALGRAIRVILDEAIVSPVCVLGKQRRLRGAELVRRLLAEGGR